MTLEEWHDNSLPNEPTNNNNNTMSSFSSSANDVSIQHSDGQIECGFGMGGINNSIGDNQSNPPTVNRPMTPTLANNENGQLHNTINSTLMTSVSNNDANSNSNADDDNGENNDQEEDKGMSLEELIYGAASFHAIVKPVSITMILAALAVIYINTEETKKQGEEALDDSYQVFTISDGQSTAASLGLSLLNSLIIVCVIGAMTFLLVLLYKYRCMKILMGYMILASTVLLGFLGGQMFYVAIDKYQLAIDKISFYFTMYNFAIVGTLAVFYQKGIPTYINQAYLVATSVIVAWQLSYFNDWMAWALLIMLALYDLFAVLTPCGPLRALVNLMQKEDAPAMPGLLYEAQLPEGATRPGRSSSNNSRRSSANETERSSGNENNAVSNPNGPVVVGEERHLVNSTTNTSETISSSTPVQTRKKRSTRHNNDSAQPATTSQGNHSDQSENTNPTSGPLNESMHSTSTLPLAIAKVYKLPLVSPGALSNIISLEPSPTSYLEQQFSAQELQTDVEAKLPRGGGRIESTRNNKGELRYVVYNRNGETKRTLLVDENGKVMEEVPRDDDDDDANEINKDNTIKLGLGDFIFYSVLVSKAAERGFSAFVACFLAILTGLGGTLVLLAVYHHALPALPISIFLAVVIYVLTIFCMEPWIHDMFLVPYYV